MFDIEWRKMRATLRLALLFTFLGLTLLLPACFASDVEVTMFGPKQYLRTTAKITVTSDSFRALAGKGKLIIQNGDGNGNNAVTDALILVNRMPIFCSQVSNQHSCNVNTSIWLGPENWVLVMMTGKPGSYLTVQIAAEIEPDATSVQVIGIGGGTVSVQNHLGDILTLEIPPLALEKDTSISVSALPNPLPSSLAKRIYPGAVLEPEGLKFSLPTKVKVVFNQALQTPDAATLCWRRDSGHVIPLANPKVSQDSVEAETYHFSTLTGDELTEAEIYALAEYINSEPVMTPGDLLAYYDAMMALADKAQALGFTDVAKSCLSWAKSLVINYTPELLADPLPSNPCGTASLDVERWEALVVSIIGRGEEADKVRARACTFNVLPASLSLQVGNVAPQGLTATLLGPAGDQRSCSDVGWFSEKEGVVELVAANNRGADLKGVSAGDATVSANCDGLLGSSSVSVYAIKQFNGSLDLMISGIEYQLTVSGTITPTGGTGQVGGWVIYPSPPPNGLPNTADGRWAVAAWGTLSLTNEDGTLTFTSDGWPAISFWGTETTTALVGVVTVSDVGSGSETVIWSVE
jgi:hypothetical protein